MTKKFMGTGTLLFSALLSIIVSFHQAGWKADAEILIFEAWIIFPYPLCWLLSLPLYKVTNSKQSSLATIFSILVFLFTCFSYSVFYFGHQSSTASLVFIFAPLYLVVASILVLGTTNVVKLLRKSDSNVVA